MTVHVNVLFLGLCDLRSIPQPSFPSAVFRGPDRSSLIFSGLMSASSQFGSAGGWEAVGSLESGREGRRKGGRKCISPSPSVLGWYHWQLLCLSVGASSHRKPM